MLCYVLCLKSGNRLVMPDWAFWDSPRNTVAVCSVFCEPWLDIIVPVHFGHVTNFVKLVVWKLSVKSWLKDWDSPGTLTSLSACLLVCLSVCLKVKRMKNSKMLKINVRISNFHTIAGICNESDSTSTWLPHLNLNLCPSTSLPHFLLLPPWSSSHSSSQQIEKWKMGDYHFNRLFKTINWSHSTFTALSSALHHTHMTPPLSQGYCQTLVTTTNFH